MDIPVLTEVEVQQRLKESHKKRPHNYLAMYSSWWGGFITDTSSMLIPVDDHLVHRGDGVFEAFRMKNKKFFLLEPHLERLKKSAELVGLPMSHSIVEIEEICNQLAHLVDVDEALVRLYMSRGPGSFSPNPYDTVGTQLYIVLTKYSPIDEEKYQKGYKACFSQIPIKSYPFSVAKTCNYLPNVLMNKEALDSGYDLAIGLNKEGFIAEGPTENVMILTSEGELIAPPFDYILRGTTLVRVMELASELRSQGKIKSILQRDISKEDIFQAQEVLVIGTTKEVISIVQLEGETVGAGKPGTVSLELRKLLRKDIEQKF